MTVWLLAHRVAVAALAGVGWSVQLVVYPAFRLVGTQGWARYHAGHTRAITRVVAVPWLVQGTSTAALLVVPPHGGRLAAVGLAALALATVVVTIRMAVPAHARLAAAPDPADVTLLLRANLARTLAWTGSAGLAATLLG